LIRGISLIGTVHARLVVVGIVLDLITKTARELLSAMLVVQAMGLRLFNWLQERRLAKLPKWFQTSLGNTHA
jgi:hypothetical protein